MEINNLPLMDMISPCDDLPELTDQSEKRKTRIFTYF